MAGRYKLERVTKGLLVVSDRTLTRNAFNLSRGFIRVRCPREIKLTALECKLKDFLTLLYQNVLY